MPHYIIKVIGKVQGVYFRASTKEEAQRLSLTGFVKNEADGSVLIKAEGQAEDLERLVEWCHHGPIRAKVERVEVDKSEATSKFSGFEIHR